LSENIKVMSANIRKTSYYVLFSSKCEWIWYFR